MPVATPVVVRPSRCRARRTLAAATVALVAAIIIPSSPGDAAAQTVPVATAGKVRAIRAYPLTGQQRVPGSPTLMFTRPTDSAWALERAMGMSDSPDRPKRWPERPSPANADRVPGIVGALIGGAIGAGLGAIYEKGSCESRNCDAGGAGAKDGAIWGAAIGATIDVLAWLKSRRDRSK